MSDAPTPIPEPPEPDADPVTGEEGAENIDSDALTHESLQAELASYRKALAEEFEASEKAAQGITRTQAEKIATDFFRKNLPMAAAQVVHLAQYSTSDATRLAASKYICDRATKELAESGDPVKDLIAQLTSAAGEE
jgi:hypothetical protein